MRCLLCGDEEDSIEHLFHTSDRHQCHAVLGAFHEHVGCRLPKQGEVFTLVAYHNADNLLAATWWYYSLQRLRDGVFFSQDTYQISEIGTAILDWQRMLQHGKGRQTQKRKHKRSSQRISNDCVDFKTLTLWITEAAEFIGLEGTFTRNTLTNLLRAALQHSLPAGWRVKVRQWYQRALDASHTIIDQ